MSTCLLLEDQVEIPLGISGLDDFRRWSRSNVFPERGRIDYIAGQLEVDMSPENLFFHGSLKSRICYAIQDRVDELELGHVFVDSTRVSSIVADSSVEPDIVVLSQAAIDDGRVRLTPAASGNPDAFIEIEGPPELVVEIVSDSSVGKDTQRLPTAYFTAGVTEYWLIDARGAEMSFTVLHQGANGFKPAPQDENGFQRSTVLQCRYKLTRRRGLGGFWRYELAKDA